MRSRWISDVPEKTVARKSVEEAVCEARVAAHAQAPVDPDQIEPRLDRRLAHRELGERDVERGLLPAILEPA